MEGQRGPKWLRPEQVPHEKGQGRCQRTKEGSHRTEARGGHVGLKAGVL